MKRFLAMMLVLAMSFSLVGCGKEPTAEDPTKPTESTGEKLAAKQEFNTYIGSEPMTLDLSKRSDTYSSTVLLNTLESLTRNHANTDGSYEIVPAGAKEWKSNDDGTVWTFTLNDNKWDDGKPVTAGDYLYSIQRTANPDTAAPLALDLIPIKNFEAVNAGKMDMKELGVKAIDDKTLEFTLTAPTPYFMDLTYGLLMAPQRQDFVEAQGDKYGAESASFIGCGPYKLASWTHNNMLEFEKNPNYWDNANVKLEKVHCKIIADANTANNAFLNNELDYVRASKTEWIGKFSEVAGVQKFITPSATLAYSFFNTDDKLFSNANVRKAFIQGINREELNEMCFSGLREPSYGWVVDALWCGDVNYREFAGQPIKDMMAKDTDPKALLVKGLEELGMDTDPTKITVSFRLAGTDEFFRTLGEYLQQAYKTSLGVNLEIDFSEWGIFIDNVEKGNFQIGFMAWGAGINDPYDVLKLFMSSSNAIHTGWSNADYDALMAKAGVEMDAKARAELYKQAEQMVLNEFAVANPLACSVYNDFFVEKLKGADVSTAIFESESWKSLYFVE